MRTMKALVPRSYGGNDCLELRQLPKPVATGDELLVAVTFAGLNPLDWKIRAGKLRLVRSFAMPQIMGSEAYGTVEAVGPNVRSFAVGDRIYARLDKRTMGGFAEFVAVRESLAAHAPKHVEADVAAGVPLVALTAWQCLFDVASLTAGARVLVHGAAGAVGRFVVQMALNAGAVVTATASASNVGLVRLLGATKVLDYRRERFEDGTGVFDVVVDLVGGETLDRSFAVVRPGGTVVSIAGPPDPLTARDIGAGPMLQLLFRLASYKQRRLAAKARATYRFLFMREDGEELRKITALIDAGALNATIDRAFPLEDYAEAFAYQESGKARGKVVLKI